MKVEARIAVFQALGRELRMILDKDPLTESGQKLAEIIDRSGLANAWFTKDNVRHRLGVLTHTLEEEVLRKWLSPYSIAEESTGKTIGVISAGNIPAAGADDFFQVLLAGHDYLGKLSKEDNLILPAIGEVLAELEPSIRHHFRFTEQKLEGISAVIATGSNNTSRYFEYYFQKYPHVIRRNRNSIAILNGSESVETLQRLGEDIFRYFGMGCRNVTKLFVPRGYSFDPFFEAILPWADALMINRKYMNNYEYNRTVYMLNKEALLDNNFLILRKAEGIASPPGVLYYEEYDELVDVEMRLKADSELIQCVVGELPVTDAVKPGMAQAPEPWDYADGVDVLKFLGDLG